MKQTILTNFNWISPTLQKGWDWSSVYSSKNEGGYNFLQEREKLVKFRGIKVAEGE